MYYFVLKTVRLFCRTLYYDQVRPPRHFWMWHHCDGTNANEPDASIVHRQNGGCRFLRNNEIPLANCRASHCKKTTTLMDHTGQITTWWEFCCRQVSVYQGVTFATEALPYWQGNPSRRSAVRTFWALLREWAQSWCTPLVLFSRSPPSYGCFRYLSLHPSPRTGKSTHGSVRRQWNLDLMT